MSQRPGLGERFRAWLVKRMPSRETLATNRWLRWLGPSLLHPRVWHMSRRGVAAGAAIGVFFAFITPIAQIPLSAAVSVMLRANIATAVVATLVNTPPTFGPVYYAAWKVGSWVLQEPTDDANAPAVLAGAQKPVQAASAAEASQAAGAPASGWRRVWATVQEIGKPLLLGTLIFAVSFSALAWLLVSSIWHWRVRRKRRARLESR